MLKVLFINPRVREEDVPRHVPYGIALLASIIMEKGHIIIDFQHPLSNNLSKEEVLVKVQASIETATNKLFN